MLCYAMLCYRQHGSPAMAVPLYVSALAIFEKTLGAEHPQVASWAPSSYGLGVTSSTSST